MTIPTAELEIYQATKQRKTFTFFTDAAQTTRLNLSTATEIRISFRAHIAETSAVFSQNATDGAIGNSWSTGVVAWDISAVNSALLTKDGVYDVTYLDASGDRKPLAYGPIQLIPKVF